MAEWDAHIPTKLGESTASIRTPITTPENVPGDADRYGVYYEPGTIGAGHFRPDARTTLERVAKNSSANAYLRYGDNYMPLWLSDVSLDFAATGMTAQSRMKRDFYHRHFTQPTVNITGQTFNQYQYNWLAKLIRRHQILQVAHGNNPRTNLMELNIKYNGDATQRNHTTKGAYRRLIVEGYVENIGAGAIRFQNAPEFTFTFIVANGREGLFAALDSLTKLSAGADFLTQFGRDSGFVKDPKIPPPKSQSDEGAGKPSKAPDDEAPNTASPELQTSDVFDQAIDAITELGASMGNLFGLENDF